MSVEDKQLFASALRFLKSTPITNAAGKKTVLSKLPVHVFIGPQGSGQTSLISETALDFVLEKQIPDDNKSSNTVTWWATKEGILLDVPGQIVTPEDEEQSENKRWSQLLTLLKRHRFSVASLTIVYPVDNYLADPESNQDLDFFFQQADTFKKIFHKNLPVFVAFNKCDYLLGFKEFFSDLDANDIHAPFGIMLKKDMLRMCDDFLGGVHQQQIRRFRAEGNIDNRSKIQSFPLQLEAFLKKVTGTLSEFNVKGFYFTSTYQTEYPTDILENKIQNHFLLQSETSLPKRIEETHTIPDRVYFTKGFLEKIILICKPQNKRSTSNHPIRRAIRLTAISLSAATLIIVGYYLSKDFNAQTSVITAIEKKLAEYASYIHLFDNKQAPSKQQLIEVIYPLKALSDAHVIKDHSSNFLGFLLGSETKKLQHDSRELYKLELQRTLLPRLQHLIESELEQALAKKEVGQVYLHLKTYLMVTQPRHRDPQFLYQWLTRYWQINELPVADLKELSEHLNLAYQNQTKASLQNGFLVKSARQLLNRVSKQDLAYQILKNHGLVSSTNYLHLVQPVKQDEALVFSHLENGLMIPQFFTAEFFDELLKNRIPAISSAFYDDVWVFAGDTSSYSPLAPHHLSKAIKERYIQDYEKTWENALNQLSIHSFNDFDSAVKLLDTITKQSNQQLVHTLHLIEDNGLKPILAAQTGSDVTTQSIPYGEIQQKLNTLHHTLKTFSANPQSQALAFAYAKDRLLNPKQEDIIHQVRQLANSMPEPVQGWLYSIANNTWDLILNNAKNHINDQWQQEVYSYYLAHIANRYPVKAKGNRDIHAAHFVEFYAPGGILSRFFRHYIEPFVDRTARPWNLLSINGKPLPLNAQVLSQFTMLENIQQQLFRKDGTLNETLKLKGVGLATMVSNLKIQLDHNKPILYKHDSSAPQVLASVPAPANTQASFLFENIYSETSKRLVQGEWAWLRLLEQSTIKPSSDPYQSVLTVGAAGNSADFKLTLENPYLLTSMAQIHQLQFLPVLI